MSLEVQKIFIDSRYRTATSKSDSDFSIQLGRNIFLPEKCICHIEHCVIPHSWYTIEEGINDTMYYTVSGNTTNNTATIPSTNYTGASLVAALNLVLTNGLTASYDINTNKIIISSSQVGSFMILTDYDLQHQYGLTSTNSCNDIITNRTTKINYPNSPWVSGMINLQGFRAVYISSSTMSNYNTLGAQGENSIIKKVITDSDFGYLIIDQIVSDHDYLNVERLSLNTIDFQIRDVRGNFIPFHDSPVSFNLVFTIRE